MSPQGPSGTTWFCIRRNGVARREGWTDAGSLTGLRRRVGAGPDEVVEVCIADNFRRVAWNRFARTFIPRALGMVGMEIAFRGEIVRLAPTRLLAANRRFGRAGRRELEFLFRGSAALLGRGETKRTCDCADTRALRSGVRAMS